VGVEHLPVRMEFLESLVAITLESAHWFLLYHTVTLGFSFLQVHNARINQEDELELSFFHHYPKL
jgi:hypothetical protein